MQNVKNKKIKNEVKLNIGKNLKFEYLVEIVNCILYSIEY